MKENKRKNGFISIIYVFLILGGIILITGIFTTYQHQLIIRNFEAAADLAAVESVRAYIDEAELRNEKLVVREESMVKIRELFLQKIREHMPSNTFEILRIEIPTIDPSGNVLFENKPLKDMVFPNSVNAFVGPFSFNDTEKNVERTSYYVGGNTSDNAAMELTKVTGNLATSGTKQKTSYILSTKVTIFFKTYSPNMKFTSELLNYYNILSGNPKSIVTKQIDSNVLAVTLQSIGQVVMQ